MRPGQQNKRGRGRNNNNNNNGRKGGNPLSRTYDSSGPDVKIRGTAQHIAEKYATLARDAQSSGDNVMAENYLQHAEHYNRIIAAAQAQMQERFQREDRDNTDRDGEREDRDGGERTQGERAQGERIAAERGNGHDRSSMRESESDHETETAEEQPAHAYVNGSGPQPVIEGTPAEVAMDEEASGTPRRSRGRRRSAAASRPRRQPRKAEADSTDEAGNSGAGAAESAASDSNERHERDVPQVAAASSE
jgi:hypothetical protein